MSSDKEEQSDVEVRGLEQRILYLDSSVLILNLGQAFKSLLQWYCLN